MSRRRVYFVIPPTNTGTFQAVVDRPGMAWLHTNVRRGLFRVVRIERYNR